MKIIMNLLLTFGLLTTIGLLYYFIMYQLDKIWYVAGGGYTVLYIAAVYGFASFIMSGIRADKIVKRRQSGDLTVDDEVYTKSKTYLDGIDGAFFAILMIIGIMTIPMFIILKIFF